MRTPLYSTIDPCRYPPTELKCCFLGIKKHAPKNVFFKTGKDLFSQAVSHQVPSALRSLTAVFGMGTGVASSLYSPDRCLLKFRLTMPFLRSVWMRISVYAPFTVAHHGYVIRNFSGASCLLSEGVPSKLNNVAFPKTIGQAFDLLVSVS